MLGGLWGVGAKDRRCQHPGAPGGLQGGIQTPRKIQVQSVFDAKGVSKRVDSWRPLGDLGQTRQLELLHLGSPSGQWGATKD